MRAGKLWWVLAALILASIPSAAAALEPRHAAPSSRAPAQARTLVGYIASGSIEIPAAAGTGYFDRGLAVDSAGNVYVGHNNLSTSGPDIAVLDPSGRLIRQWSAAPFGDGPVIAIGPDGLIYVQNNAERFVRVFTPDGLELVARRIEHGAVNTKDLEVDAAGNVYVVARGRGDGGPYSDDGVYRFSSAGQLTGYLVPRPGEGPDEALAGVAVAADGSVYITAYGGQGSVLLYHLDAAGNKLPVFDPSFFLPGIYYDVEFANGRLYFSGPLRGPAATDHTPVAAAIFSPQGELIDFTVGTLAEPNRLQQFAVHGERMYVMGSGVGPSAPATRSASQTGRQIDTYDGFPLHLPGPETETSFQADFPAAPCRGQPGHGGSATGGPVGIVFSGAPKCPVVLQQAFPTASGPCRPGFRPTIEEVNVTGRSLPPRASYEGVEQDLYQSYIFDGKLNAQVIVPRNEVRSGKIVLIWRCDHEILQSYFLAEWKGEIVVHDPSGNVLDRNTARPVQAATVLLQFSLKKEGPFIQPSVSGFVPQINPQVTDRSGFFGWDVAEGFWRLRITAYGYRPFTSPMYKVPPEVKGLRLKLRPDPRQQALVIDPHVGRAGTVRLGAKSRRVRAAGLKVRISRGRVRSITVRSKRYRTVQGVRLGAPTLALLGAYPPRTRAANTRLITATKPMGHRVGKATFTVRRGRIVGIRLGR